MITALTKYSYIYRGIERVEVFFFCFRSLFLGSNTISCFWFSMQPRLDQHYLVQGELLIFNLCCTSRYQTQRKILTYEAKQSAEKNPFFFLSRQLREGAN